MHINNLYKEQKILLLKECYALEKIHGTSASIEFLLSKSGERELKYNSSGASHYNFVKLFNETELLEKVKDLGIPNDRHLVIHGEAYGGKEQGMSSTYGNSLKFIAFDVKLYSVLDEVECWLSVPDADDIVKKLGLEFVHYVKVSTDLLELDKQRDMHSIQAVRNGVTTLQPNTTDTVNGYTLINPRKREGVVLRPLIELTLNNGERLICKHKGAEFQETATPRPVVDPSKLKVLEDANAIANEWVTTNRLEHVLQKITNHSMKEIPNIIAAMVEDVLREGSGEIIDSQAVRKSIGNKTVELYRGFLKSKS